MSDALTAILIIAAGFALSLILRMWPRLRARNYGIDAFFYLNYARAIRRQKHIPVYLNNYMLDLREQRYPPGFPLLLALVPHELLVKFNWLVNPIIDSLLGAGMGVFVWKFTESPTAVALAMCMWALTPTLVHESTNMNSRIFGNVVFVGVMLLYVHVLQLGGWWWVAALCAAGAIMLMTHKMSTQNFLFVALGFCVWRASVIPFALAALIFVVTIIITAGFYLKVLSGNIGILAFWRKNIKNLYSHMVYRSPVYATTAEVRNLGALDSTYFKPGLRGQLKTFIRVFDHNFILPLFLYIVFTEYSWWEEYEQILAAWVILTYVFVLLTAFVPPMRFMGEGVKYIKLASFPMYYLVAKALSDNAPPSLLAALGLCLLLDAVKVWRTYKAIYGNVADVGGIEPIIEKLKTAPDDGVLVLPCGTAEAVAYYCDKRVFWGAHGGGYKKLTEFFPVLRRPLHEYFSSHKLNYLILDHDYVQPKFLSLEEHFEKIMDSGKFGLYKFKVSL